jgi:hypothetical protein
MWPSNVPVIRSKKYFEKSIVWPKIYVPTQWLSSRALAVPYSQEAVLALANDNCAITAVAMVMVAHFNDTRWKDAMRSILAHTGPEIFSVARIPIWQEFLECVRYNNFKQRVNTRNAIYLLVHEGLPVPLLKEYMPKLAKNAAICNERRIIMFLLICQPRVGKQSPGAKLLPQIVNYIARLSWSLSET